MRGARKAAPAGWVVVAALFAASPAAAQEPLLPAEPADDSAALADPQAAALDAQAAGIAARLRCPVCSGQSVLESNSAIAQEMQKVIRERLEAGQSEAEIVAYFRGSYGDWISLQPRATGLNLVVYVLPAVALLAGGALVFVALRRWSGRTAGPGAVDVDVPRTAARRAELSADDEAWIERSLGR